MGCEAIDWIYRAEDREKLRAFMNAVMNLRIQYYWGNNVSNWGNTSSSRRFMEFFFLFSVGPGG
jgi:hypothetical protein